MTSKESRRQILEQVREGGISVADATALLTGAPQQVATVPEPDPGNSLVTFRPAWERRELPSSTTMAITAPLLLVLDDDSAEHAPRSHPNAVVVHAGDGAGIRREATDRYWLGTGDDRDWERLWQELVDRGRTPGRIVLITGAAPEQCLDAAYPLLRTVIRQRVADRLAMACVAVGQHSASSATALGGFCSVAALEDRQLRLVAISVPNPSTDPLTRALDELAVPAPPLAEVRYDTEGGRHVRALPEVATDWRTLPELPNGGVYVVTGGAGGIGLQLAGLLAARSAARLVLLGRSKETEVQREALRRIEALGGQARYVRADVTRPEEVAAAVAVARAEFGPLTGVLHLAGVNEDSYLVNKEPGAHRRVLAPKVAGARSLDDATQGEDLRFFVLFSSMAGYIGHAGQSDYAAAARALGSFAEYRSLLQKRGQRSGVTASVGWPLWAGGGMRLSDDDRRATEQLQGMVEMPAEQGLTAMLAAVASEDPETVIVHGDTRLIRDYVRGRVQATNEPTGKPPEASPVPPQNRARTQAVETYLLELVSELTRLAPGQLRPEQEFSTLGIDSVMIKRLSAALDDRFGAMPVTLLFEHRSVRELAHYLELHHPEALTELVDWQPRGTEAEKPVSSAAPAPSDWPGAASGVADTADAVRSTPLSDADAASTSPDGALDDSIAIVGLAGRYPGAADTDELWDALVAGRDLTSEIPADRWDKDRWFDTGGRAPGSSYGRWGGFLRDVDRFDSLFFGVAPREATRMDPAERLFLEVSWSALEDAGYSRARLHRATRTDDGHAVGVYVGTTGLAYGLVGAEEWGRGNPVSAYSMEFSLANRLSYFLDVHGPSLVVDTACSASLTALHLACEDLRRGECRMAVAGGAYLNLHPMKFAMLSEQRMMSGDGVSRAFGEGGDGFVPGEGIGAVVLKPLSAAVEDGDHVHAVIRASSISHGGRTNGYTVPSPRAHATVIGKALRRSGVDPRTLSYLEAHGTGTELGDPIEIDGLVRAFRSYTDDQQFCALGSVKSNIGHAESAAGIAGLTKVVLQLRHRTLVPTLHSDPPNRQINFPATPFRLQRHTEPWETGTVALPRRAAVSSFGAGGANTHVILEEHVARDRRGPLSERPHLDEEQLIVLSARSADRLAAMAERLASDLSRSDRVGDLRDVAYTLQVGREPLEHRMALVVRSLDELRERLTRGGARGSMTTLADTPSATATGHIVPSETLPQPDPERARELLESQRWRELGDLWVRGAEVDWEAAHRKGTGAHRPRIVPLPTYPFAGPRHWPQTMPREPAHAAGESGEWQPSPLTAHEQDNENGTAFTVTLPSGDPVVRDHLVDGQPVVAGVAQLELARATGEAHAGRRVTALSEVRWRSPLVAGTEAPVAWVSNDGDTLGVQLSGQDTDGSVVYSTATVHCAAEGTVSVPEPVALADVRTRCRQHQLGEPFYERALAAGLSYGPSYRLVRQLWCGEGESLAELDAPPEDRVTGWWLEPGVTDAALHAVHGTVPEWETPATVPASVARVDLFAPAGDARFAHARVVAADEEQGTVRSDVTLYDAEGRRLVEFTGLTVVRPAPSVRMPYFRPVWRVRSRPGPSTPTRHDGPVLVLTAGHDHGLGDALVRYMGHRAQRVDLTAADAADHVAELLGVPQPPSTIYFLGGVEARRYTPTDMEYLEESQRHGSLALFHLAQGLAAHRAHGTRLMVLTSDSQQVDERSAATNPFAASIHGLTRTLARELPFLDVSCVDLAGDELARCAELGSWESLLTQLEGETAADPLAEVALRGGTSLVKTLEPAELPAQAAEPPLRQHGRYLLIGGAGGLGRVMSEHLAQEYHARLLLVGRRAEAELPDGLLDSLRLAGAEAEYLSADVADPEAMRAAVTRMGERFGGVDGVIHTAFVLADRTLARSDDATFHAALDPKVRGTVALCDALAMEQLDFLALFSSAIAHTGNRGQSNYAAGSTFQSAYGLHLANHLHWPVTVFDWGFWGDEGAVATEEHRRRLLDWGVEPLSAAEGIAAFRQALGCQAAGHVVPLKVSTGLQEVTPLNSRVVHRVGDRVRPSVLDPISAAIRTEQAERGTPFASDYLDSVDAYGRRLVLEAITSMGFLRRAGEEIAITELADRMGVTSGQRQLFEALLAALENGGYVRCHASVVETLVEVEQASDRRAREMLRSALLSRFPDVGPTIDLMEDCATALPEVLVGARRGLEVLFPGGSDQRVRALYDQDPRTDYFNGLCAAAIEAAVRTRLSRQDVPGARPLRVLEIGAGTGGTSRRVLEALEPWGDAVSYDYTDISATLVAGARDRLGQRYPHVAFRVLDITENLLEQGFADERYDVVLATNVLHATANITETMAQVARLAAPGAPVLVNEATRVLDSITLMFGLTDGWWFADDPDVRLPHSPLLASGTWSALLLDAGMRGTRRYAVDGWSEEAAGQCLILAEQGEWRRIPRRQAAVGDGVATTEVISQAEEPSGVRASSDPGAPVDAESSLFGQVIDYLAALYADLLRLPVDELDPAVPLTAYGTDSLTTMEAVERVEKAVGSIPKEILLAGESVRGTALRLIEHRGSELAEFLRDEPPTEPITEDAPPAHGPPPVPPPPVGDHRPPTPSAAPSPVPPPLQGGGQEPVAIVGLAGRYPMAEDLDTLWRGLLAKHRAITEIPRDRWSVDERIGSGEAKGADRGWGAFLADIDLFDPLLFRISPREAERMDPAERLFLETVWEALEDAGSPPARLRAQAGPARPRVGVFAGVMHGQYELLAAEQRGRGRQVLANSSRWSIPNRVSHTFGFAGPSVTVDTACSSALTALHLASDSLRRGECEVALAGGVNVILHPSHHQNLSAAKMLSPDGHSRAFDAEANGMVTGEGVGAVVLKPLSAALRDRDRVHACVLGSALNSDGRSDTYAVPHADAQVEVMGEALRAAGVEPSSVQYVEAQATGSPVGDPVELAALRRAYGVAETGHRLAVGSLKPNIGHLEAASGMAQLAKVLLQLRDGRLAPTIDYDAPLVGDGFLVPREPVEWPRPAGDTPRRAAVSSFGAGGANAHVILEEAAVAPRDEPDEEGPHLLVLSARRPGQLQEYARRIGTFLHRRASGPLLEDVAHTLQVGREPLAYRLGIVAHDLADAARLLEAYANEQKEEERIVVGGPARQRTDESPLSVSAPDERSLIEAARAWVDGRSIDWRSVHRGDDRRVMSLPHYPFARGRYWLDLPDEVPDAVETVFPSAHEEFPVTDPSPNATAGMASVGSHASVGSTPAQVQNTRNTLITAICDLLKVVPSDIDVQDHLSDFGFDSVTMVQLADRLSAELSVEVSPAILYGYPDVAALVDYLADAYASTTALSAPNAVDTRPPEPGAAVPDVTAVSEPATPSPETAAPVAPAAVSSAAEPTSEHSPRTPRQTPSRPEPVAVVGMAGRFPGAPDTDSYWRHLIAGHDLIGHPPPGRFSEQSTSVRWGGFLEDIDQFDAEFFQVSPREARVMDPQHRLFLQTVWSAIEEAGYDPSALAGSACGLYVGVASSEYGELARERGVDIDGQLMTGNDHSMLANRISFLLDLRGPSEPVDTACSSSLVAIHRAVRAIQSAECDLAVAGGVNVILSSTGFEAFDRSGMLAADGRCKSFDHRADGYVRGEGVGAVVLKPLAQARADGDHIHALISGTATSHGGRSASLTAPNPSGQAEVIARAQEMANVVPEDIGYVEAHGTGTSLGDPIEFNGLRTAFETERNTDGKTSGQHCGLGSVKTNVGHLETAAGIAGLLKVVLALRHRMLPPTLHLERVNPLIEPARTPFYLVDSPRPWDRPTDQVTGRPMPRRAGVSSFGFGGMNAHLIVEESPATAPVLPEPSRRPHVFVLSARDDDRLRDHAEGVLEHLQHGERSGSLEGTTAQDVAYTLQVGRPALDSRLALIGNTLGELIELLRTHLDGGTDPRLLHSHSSRRTDHRPDEEEIALAVARARDGAPERLAELWVNGADPAWEQLHDVSERRRVSLPTYPFARERHWLPEPAAPEPTPPPRPEPTRQTVPEPIDHPHTQPARAPVPPHERTPASPPTLPGGLPQPTTASTAGSAESLRHHIREAVADGIGIEPHDIDSDREFASYGVDSIAAMRIMQRLQTRYGDHIPMAAILEHPSLDRLVAHLQERYVLPDAVPETADVGLGSTVHGTSTGDSRTGVAQQQLVPFAEEGPGPPAYCLYGDTGELTWLLHVSEWFADTGSVMGLEAPGFDAGEEPSGTIEEWAEQCASVIADRHGGGPCRVLGQGIAGLVAAETARRLHDRGIEVAELLLIGTPDPAAVLPAETDESRAAEVANAFGAAWGATQKPVKEAELAGRTGAEQLNVIAERLEPYAPMAASALYDYLRMALSWRSALGNAAAAYQARPVTGAGMARVVRATGGSTQTHGDYGRWIAPPPAVVELDREPWSLISAASAREIAQSGTEQRITIANEPALSPLISINRHGSGQRSVWAHNLYGEVSYAIYLSRHMGLSKPVIGLEQVGVTSADVDIQHYSSVTDMAAHYVSELREHFPDEPYVLGGCSFGGVLAYEMAYQLQQEGEEVSHLIAIDPIMPQTEAWDSVDWGTVTAVEAEAFSLVMLGNAMCQRWGVAQQILLSDLTGLTLEEQLDVVARHINENSAARPDPELIRRSVLVRHEVMLRNGDLLQEYRPQKLLSAVPTTLFHATEGFLAEGNNNELPAVPRTSPDRSNGFAEFVGDRIDIHDMRADHHTIAHDENLARIAQMISPLLDGSASPGSLHPTSLVPVNRNGRR